MCRSSDESADCKPMQTALLWRAVLLSGQLVLTSFASICLDRLAKAPQYWNGVKPRNTGDDNTNCHLTVREDLTLSKAVCIIACGVTSKHASETCSINCHNANCTSLIRRVLVKVKYLKV